MFNSSRMVPAALDISKEHSMKNVKPAGKGSSASQTVECHTGKGFMKKQVFNNEKTKHKWCFS